ncbi:hypothetical protein, partial [Sanguibacter sp. 26GB23]|uniref:hypothetical protein n=1 Tax=Sanguibacter sp. 26GB23 TaxID=3156066 RepID=UPI0032AF4185
MDRTSKKYIKIETRAAIAKSPGDNNLANISKLTTPIKRCENVINIDRAELFIRLAEGEAIFYLSANYKY